MSYRQCPHGNGCCRSHARTGVVTLIQRFGSALNLNVHLHMIVLDGVYSEHNGQAQFHPVGAPSRETLERLLDRLIKRTLPALLRDGALTEDPEQPWLNLQDPDTLDQLNAASVQYRIAVGPGAGQRTLTLRDPVLAQPADQSTPKPFTVNRDGFSLNAAPSPLKGRSSTSPRPTGTSMSLHYPPGALPRTPVAAH